MEQVTPRRRTAREPNSGIKVYIRPHSADVEKLLGIRQVQEKPSERVKYVSPGDRHSFMDGLLEITRLSSTEKIRQWLKHVEPRKDEDTELLSPFPEWSTSLHNPAFHSSPSASIVAAPAKCTAVPPQEGQVLDGSYEEPAADAVAPDSKKDVEDIDAPPQGEHMVEVGCEEPATDFSPHVLRNVEAESHAGPGEAALTSGDSPPVNQSSQIPAIPSDQKPRRSNSVSARVNLTNAQLPSIAAKLSQAENAPPPAAAAAEDSSQIKIHRRSHSIQPKSHHKNLSNTSQALRPYREEESVHSRPRSRTMDARRSTTGIPIQARGRPLHRYDFDFQFGATPAMETPQEQRDTRRDSHLTTFSEIIRRGDSVPTRRSRSASPPKSSRKLQKSPSKATSKASSSDRTEKRRPPALDLNDARRYGELIKKRRNTEAVHNPITPWEAQRRQVNEDGTSSPYTADSPVDSAPTISPLHIVKDHSKARRVNVLRAYNTWKEHEGSTPAAENGDGAVQMPARSMSIGGASLPIEPVPSSVYSRDTAGRNGFGIPKSATMDDLSRIEQPEQYTPLTPWIVGADGHTRKASKRLFGEHGWLQDTASPIIRPELRKTGILGSIKKRARELAGKADLKPTRLRSALSTTKPQRATISLDPREQSLIYCELEFILSNALDSYIHSQLNGGRLDPDKLKKINDIWTSKGRPRIVGFRYDLETQIDLVALHVESFRFYSFGATTRRQQQHASAETETAIAGLLAAMKANARQMRIRTLCRPDPVIAKQVLDSQALLGLLGATEGSQIAMAEVSQFFRVVVEREKAIRERLEELEARRSSVVTAVQDGGAAEDGEKKE